MHTKNDGLTHFHAHVNRPRMGRKKLWAERLHVTLPEGAKARIAAALREGEDMLDLIREAIDRELKRRESRRQQVESDERSLKRRGKEKGE
jgi:hypothetical protein